MELCSDVVGVVFSNLELKDILSYLITCTKYYSEKKTYQHYIQSAFEKLYEIIKNDLILYAGESNNINIWYKNWKILVKKDGNKLIFHIIREIMQINRLYIKEFWRMNSSNKNWMFSDIKGTVKKIQLKGHSKAMIIWESTKLIPYIMPDYKIKLLSWYDVYHYVPWEHLYKDITILFDNIFGY